MCVYEYGVTGLVSCRLRIRLKGSRSYDVRKGTLSTSNIAIVFGVRILEISIMFAAPIIGVICCLL